MDQPTQELQLARDVARAQVRSWERLSAARGMASATRCRFSLAAGVSLPCAPTSAALCWLSLFVGGCSSGCSSMSRTSEPNTRLPARWRSLALHLARGRGSPPLRCAPDPGTPFLDQQTSQMFRSRARYRVMSDSERAAACRGTRTTTSSNWSEEENEQVGDGGGDDGYG
jgi:hypothetical protein